MQHHACLPFGCDVVNNALGGVRDDEGREQTRKRIAERSDSTVRARGKQVKREKVGGAVKQESAESGDVDARAVREAHLEQLIPPTKT